jgi:hypothetical protein
MSVRVSAGFGMGNAQMKRRVGVAVREGKRQEHYQAADEQRAHRTYRVARRRPNVKSVARPTKGQLSRYGRCRQLDCILEISMSNSRFRVFHSRLSRREFPVRLATGTGQQPFDLPYGFIGCSAEIPGKSKKLPVLSGKTGNRSRRP